MAAEAEDQGVNQKRTIDPPGWRRLPCKYLLWMKENKKDLPCNLDPLQAGLFSPASDFSIAYIPTAITAYNSSLQITKQIVFGG